MVVTAMDINVTTRNLKKNKIFLFLFIKYTKKNNNGGNGDGYKRDT